MIDLLLGRVGQYILLDVGDNLIYYVTALGNSERGLCVTRTPSPSDGVNGISNCPFSALPTAILNPI